MENVYENLAGKLQFFYCTLAIINVENAYQTYLIKINMCYLFTILLTFLIHRFLSHHIQFYNYFNSNFHKEITKIS